jgi:hypothetical protein
MFVLNRFIAHVLFLGQPSAFWNIIIYTISQQTGAVPS